MLAASLFCTLVGATTPALAAEEWTVLSNDLKGWREPTGQWFVAGGAHLDPTNPRRLVAEPGGGVLINGKNGTPENLISRQEWGDVEVSLEFMIPRGSNSGVKLESVYEVQIFDSWKVARPTGADCGGIYPRAELLPTYHHIDEGIAPRVNACRAPGQWQTLEIAFRVPRFDPDGRKRINARMDKVVLNGTLIHDHVEVRWPTGHIWRQKEHPRDPLLLQSDHGPVAFRNIRVRPLPPAPKREKAAAARWRNYDLPPGRSITRLLALPPNRELRSTLDSGLPFEAFAR
jgi:hypothetical protein